MKLLLTGFFVCICCLLVKTKPQTLSDNLNSNCDNGNCNGESYATTEKLIKDNEGAIFGMFVFVWNFRKF